MATHADPVVIKKYANRRLYNTGTSCYVTLEDLAAMVKKGDDFVVRDAKTGEDITRNVLTQIIFDAESKGHSLLPTTFLRQLIRFYGDSLQTLVPPFLEHSLASFTRERDKMRSQWDGTFGSTAVQAMEEQARRNMELFQRSMRMLMPFGGEVPTPREREGRAAGRGGDLEELRSQVAAMQARIDQLVTERDAAVAGDRSVQPEGAAEPERAPDTESTAETPEASGAPPARTSAVTNGAAPARRSGGRKAKSG